MEGLEKFWEQVLVVWDKGFMGVSIGRIVVAIAILFAFVILRGLITKFIINRIKKFTEKTKNELDDDIVAALEKPLRMLPLILGIFIAAHYLNLKGDVSVFADKLVRSMIVTGLFWALVNVLEPLTILIDKLRAVLHEALLEWLVKLAKWLLIFIGVATVLEIWGIKIGPIIAGLGLFGVAVALGAQDMFKNLIAGMLIIIENRYQPGDWVMVPGVVEGTVENIGFRSTLIRRFDKAPVYVPNTKLSDNPVTNFSEMTHRRIYWKIGVLYSTNVDQLKQIRSEMEQYVLNNDAFAKPPEVTTFCRVDSFNDSSIDLSLYCFTKTTVWTEWLEIKEELAFKIKEIVLGAGSDFAYPSMTIYHEYDQADMPEAFEPPKGK